MPTPAAGPRSSRRPSCPYPTRPGRRSSSSKRRTQHEHPGEQGRRRDRGDLRIGRATAQRFVEEGAFVFVTGRRSAELDAAVGAPGPNARGIRGDVARPDDLDELYDRVREHGRGLDVLFADAGGGAFATLDQITPDQFDETFAINVRGTVFTVQKALPLLNPGASIILAGSTAATSATPAFGVYAASKAAIRSFGRTWATELADRRIRVDVIVPARRTPTACVGSPPTPRRPTDW